MKESGHEENHFYRENVDEEIEQEQIKHYASINMLQSLLHINR